MKKVILSTLIIILALTTQAQSHYKITGNTITLDTTIKSAKSTGSPTQYTFIDKKGTKYPVYKSVNGKYFYNKVSAKSGNPYKVYLTLQ